MLMHSIRIRSARLLLRVPLPIVAPLLAQRLLQVLAVQRLQKVPLPPMRRIPIHVAPLLRPLQRVHQQPLLPPQRARPPQRLVSLALLLLALPCLVQKPTPPRQIQRHHQQPTILSVVVASQVLPPLRPIQPPPILMHPQRVHSLPIPIPIPITLVLMLA